MQAYEAIFASAAQLPADLRMQLIEALWETLPDEQSPGISPEWSAELDRRNAEIEAGAVTLVAWQDVQARAHDLTQKRQQ